MVRSRGCWCGLLFFFFISIIFLEMGQGRGVSVIIKCNGHFGHFGVVGWDVSSCKKIAGYVLTIKEGEWVP